MTIPQIPAFCFGKEYQSVSRYSVPDLGTGDQQASLGLVVPNRIAVDCLRKDLPARALAILQSIPVRRRIEMSVKTADIFASHTLKCGDTDQTPFDYIQILARTSGLSYVLVRENTERICWALRHTEEIMKGLSRGLPLDIYDTGLGEQGGATVRIVPRIKALGACMPNNSPGVNVIWIISLALITFSFKCFWKANLSNKIVSGI